MKERKRRRTFPVCSLYKYQYKKRIAHDLQCLEPAIRFGVLATTQAVTRFVYQRSARTSQHLHQGVGRSGASNRHCFPQFGCLAVVGYFKSSYSGSGVCIARGLSEVDWSSPLTSQFVDFCQRHQLQHVSRFCMVSVRKMAWPVSLASGYFCKPSSENARFVFLVSSLAPRRRCISKTNGSGVSLCIIASVALFYNR